MRYAEPGGRSKKSRKTQIIGTGDKAKEFIFYAVCFRAGRTLGFIFFRLALREFGKRVGKDVRAENGNGKTVTEGIEVSRVKRAKTACVPKFRAETPVGNMLKQHIVDVPNRSVGDDRADGAAGPLTGFFKREIIYVLLVRHALFILHEIIDYRTFAPHFGDVIAYLDVVGMHGIQVKVFL